MRDTYQELSGSYHERVWSYFKQRGFECVRLDIGKPKRKGKRPDFRVEKGDCAFICEVEVIFSGGIGQSSDFWHNDFIERTRKHFDQPHLRELPFYVAISTPNLYALNEQERNKMCIWLEDHLRGIEKECEGARWRYHKYPLASDQGWIFFQIYGPIRGTKLELKPYAGGAVGINKAAVLQRVDHAMKQLRSHAEVEAPDIPRIIVLASASAFFDIMMLWLAHSSVIKDALIQNPDLSALALLDPVPVDAKEAKDAFGLVKEALESGKPLEIVDRFIVFHNPNVINARPLDRGVFDDGYSKQYIGQPW